MKINGSELGSVVRMIVKEELQKLLPTLISECLAERYLKKVMAEALPRAKASPLREFMAGDHAEEDWEEEVPKAMANDNQGIYHKSPLMKGKSSVQNEAARREMLSKVMGGLPEDLFEGVQSTNMIPGANAKEGSMGGGEILSETQQQFGAEGVPLEMLSKIGTNFGKMKAAMAVPPPAKANEPYEMKMRQLEMQRKALDVPAK